MKSFLKTLIGILLIPALAYPCPADMAAAGGAITHGPLLTIEQQKLMLIGMMTGGLAHDFNNYLMAATMGLQLIEGAPLQPTQLQQLKEIQGILGRATDLARQLLNLGKPAVYYPTTFDVSEELTLLSPLLQASAKPVAVFVERRAEKAYVEMDKGHLSQVLMNLVINARDAVREAKPFEGKIKIRVKEMVLAKTYESEQEIIPAGKYAVIQVKDNGTGMSQEVLDNLYEPFFTTKPQGQGTGLGMVIVSKLVDQANGKILIHSKVGKGTEFLIFLPRVEPNSTSADTKRYDLRHAKTVHD